MSGLIVQVNVWDQISS